MVGLSDLFTEGFPILLQYVKVFHVLFEELLPDLFDHFQVMDDALWINKWI